MRLPKSPDWRWRAINVLLDSSYEDDSMKAFIAFLRRECSEDVSKLLELEDLISEHDDAAIWMIRDAPPIRDTVQHMAMEGCPVAEIANVIKSKFKRRIDIDIIKRYLWLFWDTENVSAYEIAKWKSAKKEKIHRTPPTPSRYRKDYLSHKMGESVDLDPEDVIKEMFVASFFLGQELFEKEEYTLALRAHKQALDIYKLRKQNEQVTKGTKMLCELLDIKFTELDPATEAEDLDGEIDIEEITFDEE